MTIQEMHIGIDLYLQKVNSDYVDSLLPEEKDWFINDEQKRFIFNRINEISNDKRQGFQFNQKRYDDLENLIVSNYGSIALIRDNISNYIGLPANYLYLLNDRSKVDFTCVYGETSTKKTKIYYVVIDLSQFNADDLEVLQIIYNDSIIFDVGNYPNFTFTQAEIFNLFTTIKDVINGTSNGIDDNGNLTFYQLYWEVFYGLYFPNQLILQVNEDDIITIEGDKTDITLDVQEITVNYFVTNKLKEKQVPNRLTKTENIYEVIRGAFTRPDKESPVSAMEAYRIVVYHNGYFILGEILMDYIRTPRNVSLPLGINSELNPNIHEELIEQTSKRIAAYIETRNYSQISAEDKTKE